MRLAPVQHGIAKLHEAGLLAGLDDIVNATLTALESDAVRVVPGMNSQGLANVIHAYAVLGRMAGEPTWAALEAAAVRVAPDMNAQEVANTVWGFSSLGRMPRDKAWAALGVATAREAPRMKPQAVVGLYKCVLRNYKDLHKLNPFYLEIESARFRFQPWSL
jgi:hypothetical protein